VTIEVIETKQLLSYT